MPPGFKPFVRCGLMLAGILIFSACTAQYPLNTKIEITQSPHLVRHKLASLERSDRLFLVLAFSGGGTRAAALSYGVLEALAKVELPDSAKQNHSAGREHTLLGEVDMIYSVSGGSFTAAYYGLHGEDMFKDYRERFLIRNHQGILIRGMLNPLNWFRLWSPRFGRSDMAQEYYDSVIFNGATLGDLVKGKGPLVIPLATDANDGLTFTFTPDQFALICSDFEQFPLSRAVAASGAFPGLFSPIILRNYAGQCDTKVPSWITDALEKPDLTSRTYYHALRTNTYLDPETKPYIHLVDGGVADNLGLRASMAFIAASGGMRDYLREVGFDKTRRVAFIIVDAATQEVPRWRLLDEIPGLGTILGVSSSIMINKYNFETIDLFRRYVQDWTDDNAAAGKKPISFYIIHVAFNALPDQKEREYFQNISTTLYLHEDQVDKLRGVAERLLYASGPFQKLVRDLGGKIPEPKPVDDKTSTSKK